MGREKVDPIRYGHGVEVDVEVGTLLGIGVDDGNLVGVVGDGADGDFVAVGDAEDGAGGGKGQGFEVEGILLEFSDGVEDEDVGQVDLDDLGVVSEGGVDEGGVDGAVGAEDDVAVIFQRSAGGVGAVWETDNLGCDAVGEPHDVGVVPAALGEEVVGKGDIELVDVCGVTAVVKVVVAVVSAAAGGGGHDLTVEVLDVFEGVSGRDAEVADGNGAGGDNDLEGGEVGSEKDLNGILVGLEAVNGVVEGEDFVFDSSCEIDLVELGRVTTVNAEKLRDIGTNAVWVFKEVDDSSSL